jgi:hypothetical protein
LKSLSMASTSASLGVLFRKRPKVRCARCMLPAGRGNKQQRAAGGDQLAVEVLEARNGGFWVVNCAKASGWLCLAKGETVEVKRTLSQGQRQAGWSPAVSVSWRSSATRARTAGDWRATATALHCQLPVPASVRLRVLLVSEAARRHRTKLKHAATCPALPRSRLRVRSVALSHMLPCGEEGALVPPQRVTVSSQAPATPRRSLMLPTTPRTRIYPMHTR